MDNIKGNSVLDLFFADDTMSVHFKENNKIFKKNGKPGDWKSIHEEKSVTRQELQQLIDQIFKEVELRDDAFLEIDKALSKVVQLGPYRIVIVYPPLSDGMEMTVVKPIKRLSLDDYELDEEILEMLRHHAKGILVSGSPGSGKTTFAQAVVDMYVEMNKVVKTLESPRDLMVPNDVVQYSFSYGSHSELRDILLLSRPDFTVYDEVRNYEDFQLYKDLRLTGIGLVGVIHATRAVDSIQRFLGTIELGIIPQVIDTVIYIKDGAIADIYQLTLKVKVPTGMNSEDLSRPVIEIRNFFSDKLEFELYSYGEQIVVIPLSDVEDAYSTDREKSLHYATLYLQDYFDTFLGFPNLVHLESASLLKVYVHPGKKGGIIGKGGDKIMGLEKKLGLSIKVRTFEELPFLNIRPEVEVGKKRSYLTVGLPENFANQTVSIFVDNKIVTLRCGPDATFTLTKKQLIRDIETNGLQLVDHRNL